MCVSIMGNNKEKYCKQIEEADLKLKEWGLRGRISRENTSSRRFSASNLKSFREEAAATSFRSNISISSTASSPGYTARDEIDPSTYSFTTALKALQAKTVYRWEYGSTDGLVCLNSKWNDAEKYISNPLSGEVPVECLSARSFRARITMSAPLIYPPHMHDTSPISQPHYTIPPKEEKKRCSTRDVGTQSTPVAPTEEEGSSKAAVSSSGELNSNSEVEEVKETSERERKNGSGGERKMMWRCSKREGGCLSLRGLWRRAVWQREKHKSRTNTTKMAPTFLEWCTPPLGAPTAPALGIGGRGKSQDVPQVAYREGSLLNLCLQGAKFMPKAGFEPPPCSNQAQLEGLSTLPSTT